jgi:hypothetical protein
MNKISFPIFLLALIVLPISIIYMADRNGAITNPKENESEFINLISPEVYKTLTDEEKRILLERSLENSINILHPQDTSSNYYKNGSFFSVFFNDVNKDDNWFEFSFGKQSKDDYFSFKLKTGLYEKLTLSKHTDDDDIILFEHYIPLLQNKYNTLQTEIVDGHILFILNRKIIFHLLFEKNPPQGRIDFESNSKEIHFIRQAGYTSFPDSIKNKIKNAVKQIPFIPLKNKIH